MWRVVLRFSRAGRIGCRRHGRRVGDLAPASDGGPSEPSIRPSMAAALVVAATMLLLAALLLGYELARADAACHCGGELA